MTEAKKLPKHYNPVKEEPKWVEKWKEMDLYKFSRENSKEVFVIDTPPPFTSGELHIGRSYACIISDTVARYKRMKGFNVLLPQGWDTQGLPTELKVEREYKPKDMDSFLEACKDWTAKAIKKMKDAMHRLGYIPDWSFEYKTMDPSYHRKVQLSLIEMFEKGLLYRGKHPVHWCPYCKTALAQAEIGYVQEEGFLNYIVFKVEGEPVTVATTRPELLHACVAVAVHPQDERYIHLHGKKAEVPLFKREVPVLTDKEVDMDFGSGVVMICTFGDEQDIKWVKRHSLPIIQAVNERGELINSGRYDGLRIPEAREKMVKDLEKEDLLLKRERIPHSVLVHKERSTCQKPVEFLLTWQFFIKTQPYKEKIKEESSKMRWVPKESLNKLFGWVDSIEWDWVISRQRTFGTPIPFWVCNKCNYLIPARKEDLPVYPAVQPSPVDKCPRCGSEEIEGVTDVCDCWVDSSITPLVISGWPDKRDLFEKTYPSTLRQQGSEIIRTWAFYTIFRSLSLTGKLPFKELLINGMIFGPDGKAMSSSLGNVIMPEEVVGKYGADSLRQTLLSFTIGSDFPFKWKDVKYASDFLQKFWNAFRFVHPHLETLKNQREIGADKLETIDKCFLARLQTIISQVTWEYEKYRFDNVLRILRKFIWEEFCDYYIELVKWRVYSKKEQLKKSAVYTLQKSISTFTKMMAPITPFFSEELHQYLPGKKEDSVHAEKWPEQDISLINKELEETWKGIMDIVSTVRKYKAKNNLKLKHPLKKVIISTPKKHFHMMKNCLQDLKETLVTDEIEVKVDEGRNHPVCEKIL